MMSNISRLNISIAAVTAIVVASCGLTTAAGAATTVNYTVGTSQQNNPTNGINFWRFSGDGNLSFASGLADGVYNQNVLSSFGLTIKWIWNVNVPNPPGANITFPAATWDFGLSDISDFALTMTGQAPVALAFTLNSKTPNSSIPALENALGSVGLNSGGDPSFTFVLGSGNQLARFPGDITSASVAESVPEPSVWTTMFLGLAVTGWAMRRRQYKGSIQYITT